MAVKGKWLVKKMTVLEHGTDQSERECKNSHIQSQNLEQGGLVSHAQSCEMVSLPRCQQGKACPLQQKQQLKTAQVPSVCTSGPGHIYGTSLTKLIHTDQKNAGAPVPKLLTAVQQVAQEQGRTGRHRHLLQPPAPLPLSD